MSEYENEKMMAHLRSEYDGIEVPDTLETLVNSEIQKAENDMKNGKVVNISMARRITKGVGIAVAASFCAIILGANINATTSHAMSEIPVIGAVAKVVTFRNFSDVSGDATANVDTPAISGADESVNSDIAAYTDTIIDQYKADVAAAGGDAKEAVDVSYETATDNDMIYALRLNTTVTMADSGTSVRIYDVNKKTGEIILMKDLFEKESNFTGVLTNAVDEQMRAQMADGEATYFLDDDVADANFKGVTGDENFYFNADGNLVLVYDEGTVAPMSEGVREFVIPKDVTNAILKEAFRF